MNGVPVLDLNSNVPLSDYSDEDDDDEDDDEEDDSEEAEDSSPEIESETVTEKVKDLAIKEEEKK